MKKIILSAVMMVAAVSFASAQQWFVGGSLGVSTSSAQFGFDEDGDLVASQDKLKTTNFTVVPKFGYIFNDNWMVGLGIGYAGTSEKMDVADAKKNTTGEFVVNPYVRYTAWEVGRFALAFQADVDAAFGTYKLAGEKVATTTGLGINIAPVVEFDLTDNVLLEARLNFASLGYNSVQVDPDMENVEKATNSSFNFGVNSDNAFTTGALQVGFIVKF